MIDNAEIEALFRRKSWLGLEAILALSDTPMCHAILWNEKTEGIVIRKYPQFCDVKNLWLSTHHIADIRRKVFLDQIGTIDLLHSTFTRSHCIGWAQENKLQPSWWPMALESFSFLTQGKSRGLSRSEFTKERDQIILSTIKSLNYQANRLPLGAKAVVRELCMKRGDFVSERAFDMRWHRLKLAGFIVYENNALTWKSVR